MKKKILSLCVVGALALTAVGGTLAYFTDTDAETNTFTVGKIDITLNEEFDNPSNLVPGVDINKDVTITLEAGSEDSYVWYTYAIPAVLDNDDASKNIVHVNHAGATWDDYREESKYWLDGQNAAYPVEQTWDVDYAVEKGGYTDENGIVYNVYSTLYHGVMTAGDETTIAMTNVYMDTKVDTLKAADGSVVEGQYTINGSTIDYDFSKGVNIIVNAYGIQANGLSDADNNGTIDVYDAYALYNAQN